MKDLKIISFLKVTMLIAMTGTYLCLADISVNYSAFSKEEAKKVSQAENKSKEDDKGHEDKSEVVAATVSGTNVFIKNLSLQTPVLPEMPESVIENTALSVTLQLFFSDTYRLNLFSSSIRINAP